MGGSRFSISARSVVLKLQSLGRPPSSFRGWANKDTIGKGAQEEAKTLQMLQRRGPEVANPACLWVSLRYEIELGLRGKSEIFYQFLKLSSNHDPLHWNKSEVCRYQQIISSDCFDTSGTRVSLWLVDFGSIEMASTSLVKNEGCWIVAMLNFEPQCVMPRVTLRSESVQWVL